MKRDITRISDFKSAVYRTSAPSSLQPPTGVVDDGGATENAIQEDNQRTVDGEQLPLETMDFPGPFAHVPPPAVVDRFAKSDGIAPPTASAISAATDAPAGTPELSVPTDAPANGVSPAVAATHPGQTALADAPERNPDGLPPLILAARLGKVNEVQQMLLDQPGPDINQVDSRFGSTALRFAAQAGNCEIVALLLARGADVNVQNSKYGMTALTYASAKGHLPVVKALLAHLGIRVDLVNKQGLSALTLASAAGYVEIVQALLGAGADVNFKDPIHDMTALMYASKAGKLPVVKVLLAQPGIRVDLVDKKGWHALGLASTAGHVEIVQALLARGADVNSKPFENSKTALIYAAEKGRAAVVSVLLEHHCLIRNLPVDDAKWALLYAAENGHVNILRQLVASGVSVNGGSHLNQKTVLITAIAAGQLETVKALLTLPGIQVNEFDADGRSALSWASENGHVDIVELLIGAGADFWYPDASRQTNMYRAGIAGHANVVECLLGNGAPDFNEIAAFPADVRRAVCLADLFLDRRTPAASPDNPLRVFNTRSINDPNFFFSGLLDVLTRNAGANANAAVSAWLETLGIRRAVIAPMMQSLGNLSQVWSTLAVAGQASPSGQQMLAYFLCTVSRLAVLASDQQNCAPYREARLSPAGLDRLSKIAIAQRTTLVALAEEATAQTASYILDKLVSDCRVKTSYDLVVERDALRSGLITDGFVSPLAAVLADSWHAAMAELASTQVPMPQTRTMQEMLRFLDERAMSEGSRLFIRNLAKRLGSYDVLAQWQAMLGNASTEGLFALLNDQCRQLRDYCEQMSSGSQ